MKQITALLLILMILLSLAACGADTPAAEATAAESQTPTQQAESLPPEPLTVTGEQACLEQLRAMGYTEFRPDLYAEEIQTFEGVSGASVTPISMEVNEDGFTLKASCVEYFYETRELRQTDDWTVYGTRADALGVFLDLESQGYVHMETNELDDDSGRHIYRMAEYTYYLLNQQGKAEAMALVTAAYYPNTKNLYNVVQIFYQYPEQYGAANMTFAQLVTEAVSLGETELVTWEEHTIELKNFALQCDGRYYVYQYRPGMSLSDWACSELNVDGWIPWYGDAVLSPDRAYVANTGYLDMGETMDSLKRGHLLLAEKYDGSGSAVGGGTVTSTIDPFAGNQGSVVAESGVVDQAALEEFLAQQGLSGVPVTVIPVDGSGENPMQEAMEKIESQENRIASKGNICVPVAHMVNARTPLFTPGFRIISKDNGLAAYHSVEMGYGDYLLDDVLDVYMNGIGDDLIPHIKLYAFPESEEFLQSLEGQTILDAHPTPFAQDHQMLTIPEDAVCLEFKRVTDGKEAPGTPNARKPGHENLNKDAVYARYVTKEDPNFGPGVNLVFAITYDEELVYWIHMGANFRETSSVDPNVKVMSY